MSFRLVPKSVTLNDLERRNGVISLNLVNIRATTTAALICGGIYARVLESIVFCSLRRRFHAVTLTFDT